jgi:UDP-N-acetylglucosamine 2-epimerase
VKVLSVVGNRPQFIKSAPLSTALRRHGIDEAVVHTGQHYDRELSLVFFEELGLPEPRHRLDLRTPDPAVMEPAIAAAAREERADWAVVYGDTSSTIAGARAAAGLWLPLAHVEAGLRSGDLAMPEEHNRIETDRLAQLLLCPDERSGQTLKAEGVPGLIEVVGDVMYDASVLFAPLARERYEPPQAPGTYVVATIHREANVAHPRLGRIVEGLNRLDEPVVFPAHPRTRAALEGVALAPHVELVEPLGYLQMTAFVADARVVVTDSGGLQKEAYWLGVPCVTARPSTEWIDTVEVGANVLVDDDPHRLATAVAEARMPEHRPQLYGDGAAADRIAALLGTLARA